MSTPSNATDPEVHIMLDLETLGVVPGSVVCSLAAVHFDIISGQIYNRLHERIDIQSCLDVGLTVSGETIKWWMSQSEAARAEITAPSDRVKDVLTMFTGWLQGVSNRNPKRLRIWGNGANFDNPILEAVYNACKLEVPWPFWSARDVRTIVALAPEIKKSIPFEGVQHNPLCDAEHQVKYLCATLNAIKIKTA